MAQKTGVQIASSIVQAIIGWILLLAIFVATLLTGAVEPVVYTLFAFSVALLFAFQVLLDAVSGVHPKIFRRQLLALVIYGMVTVWLWVQATAAVPATWAHPSWAAAPDPSAQTVSADPSQGRLIVMRLICYGLVFYIFARCAMSGRQATRYLRAFALFSTALAVYGLQSGWSEAGPVRASFINRNTYATVAVFGTLANLAAFWDITFREGQGEFRSVIRNILERFFAGGWVFAFGFLVCFSALALTASRAGGLAGLVGLVVFFWAVLQHRGQGVRFFWLFPFSIVAFVLTVMSSDVLERVGSATHDARFLIYPYVVEGILDRPFLGHGAGAFQDAFRVYVPAEAGFADWDLAHSTYLENAFEYGLPAALVLYVGLLLIGLQLMRGVKLRRERQTIPAFALACFAAAAFHSMFDFSLQMPSVAAMFAAIIGIGWAQSFRQSEIRLSRRRARTSNSQFDL